MSTCSRCQQPAPAHALTCPTCGLALKAFGHQGIQLHRAQTGQFLCTTCVYDKDDTCTYPQRPYAEECTLYRDLRKPVQPSPAPPELQMIGLNWCRRHGARLALGSLVAVAIWLTLRR